MQIGGDTRVNPGPPRGYGVELSSCTELEHVTVPMDI